MLKTQKHGRLWLVTQPDHAQVAGYLAAHWGNDDFVRPGYFSSVPDPERLRAETVMAVALHDNGWWEWEAIPDLADVDGFPSALADVLKNQQEGMNRWRLGLHRFDKPGTIFWPGPPGEKRKKLSTLPSFPPRCATGFPAHCVSALKSAPR